jgi:hypothetical protein
MPFIPVPRDGAFWHVLVKNTQENKDVTQISDAFRQYRILKTLDQKLADDLNRAIMH